jgi:hypothetical protein
MALIIEAPNEVYSLANNNNIKLFLAGGITNCPDWQSELIKKLKKFPNLTIYNPRRANFPIGDIQAADEQVTWEFDHLREANIIIFWFSKGSLNPISLYELGMWGNSRETAILIGVDPDYERKQDVIIQTALARPEVEIYNSLDEIEDKMYEIFETK